MRKAPRRFLLPMIVTGFLAMSSVSYGKAVDFQFTEEQSKTAVDILDKLATRHYRNQPFDDHMSQQMLDKYLESLDPAKAFFLQKDIDKFHKDYGNKLDDTLSEGDLKPGYNIFVKYFNRANDRLDWVIKNLEDPDGFQFDFTKEESIPIGRDSQHWATSEKEADEMWRKRIKASILSLKLADETTEEARDTLLHRYKNQLTRLEQEDSSDVFEAMINALTLLYDPHTSYLSPRTLENFNISMSLSLEGIGAVLQAEDEYTKVVRLITAGPAAKQGELKPADKIVAVGQGDDGDMVDVVGWRLDDVVKLIRGPQNTVVRLKVIPGEAAGNTANKEIRISRDKVKLEEQAAKKGIMQLTDGDKVYKVGVINVPAFYIDFEAYRRRDPSFKSTTKDVYRLIKELEQENIDGLVIDLRNNGGGSLQEATTLTDLFIDQGPVVQIRQTSQTISRNYRSRHRAVYRGPLVVLTNRLSASASEIFAGAIQDYRRGLIVGTQTFGKGTVQSLTPVYSGQLKITESKFYRVSGGSTQHKGVIPDVTFPFLVDADQVGESSYDTALPWDQIHPVPHEDYYDFGSIINDVTKRYDVRKLKDPDFVYLNKQVEIMNENKARTQLSLNEKQRIQEQKQREAESLAIENERREAKGLALYKDEEEFETEQKAETEERIEEANSVHDLNTDDDALLSEAGYILIDMVDLLRKQPANQVANF
ncbi:carboxy terminal-processing peptidase [Pseudomaricurvus sp.]|uniref:carboxy terminal-processing peptidase n=1 Tax=Pseudomaricurvus sp. TaxID=2004510 RepID=UPI003F6B7857